MFKLALDKVEASLENFNPRTEKEGQEDVPAMTLRLSAIVEGKKICPFFGPDAYAHFFTKGEKDLASDGIVIRDRNEVFPMRREEKMTGATAKVHYGVDVDDPMEFKDVKCDAFALSPLDGGYMVVAFNFHVKGHPEHVEILYGAQKQKITLTITPPELSEMKAAA